MIFFDYLSVVCENIYRLCVGSLARSVLVFANLKSFGTFSVLL